MFDWFNVPISFAWPVALGFAIVLVPILWAWKRRRNPLGHSNIEMHNNIPGIPLIGKVPIVLFGSCILALVCAIAQPQWADKGKSRYDDVRDFVIQVDVSGSMFGQINDPDLLKRVIADEEEEEALRKAAGFVEPTPDQMNPQDPRQAFRMQQLQQAKNSLTRVRMARYSTKMFIKTREGDRVALFTFDDRSYPCAPLSKDLWVVGQKTRVIGMRSGGGTDFEGQQGAIQTSIKHFNSLGKAKTKVIILISDGEAGISEERGRELYEQMNQPGVTIRMYAFVIGGKEQMNNDYTKALKKFIDKVGGDVFWAGDPAAMEAGYAKINELEKTRVEFRETVTYHSISIYFYGTSLALLALYLLSTLVVRENA